MLDGFVKELAVELVFQLSAAVPDDAGGSRIHLVADKQDLLQTDTVEKKGVLPPAYGRRSPFSVRSDGYSSRCDRLLLIRSHLAEAGY